MRVRAKFKVDAINRTTSSRPKRNPDGTTVKNDRGYDEYEPCEMRTIVLSPVYANGDPAHENTKFWQATPSGRLELGCINLDAAEAFDLGKEYYLDFTPADETK